MPITSIDDTTISMVCLHGDAEEWDIMVANAKVGTAKSPNLIDLSGCSNPLHKEGVCRTYDNPTKVAGAVNGLHRALVTAAQWGGDWQTLLEAETEGDKPEHHYALSGTPRVLARGIDGEWPIDLAAMVTLWGLTRSAAFVRSVIGLNVLVTDDDDSAIGSFGTSAFGETTERDSIVAALKTRKAQKLAL